ncbi:ABC transporter permease [Thalassotalea psychrophila]|uniref:Transport permease protein n=1 Tax=Thalassotalea psychrophila TaxID=3065647 RepID=A0ABY9TRZ5_9GAMM|nr:ABC transporter permease [Colwelliaceae bacterium SQ149]
MFKFSRFAAVVKARNLEFFRDKSSLAWNILFPVLLLVIFSFAFSGDGRAVYKVGVIEQNLVEVAKPNPFMQTKYIDFVQYKQLDKAMPKLDQHGIDMIIDLTHNHYWVNEQSPKSYMVEKIFIHDADGLTRMVTTGEPIRYIDWVLPGIFGMNMMFSCLFGVGYVIVRYRKNSVLKRLKATPLSALEFISAQLLSRLFIVLFMVSVVYSGCNLFFDFIMLGSYLNLFLIAVAGAMSLISLGLLISTRSKSEELVGGLLNMATWPMMLLSGVWFSLEGAPQFVQNIAEVFPLTHLVSAARSVITEGATLQDVSYQLTVLLSMTAICLLLSAKLFSWDSDR